MAHIAMPSFSDGLSLAYMLNVAQIPFVVGVHSNFGRPVPLRRKWVIRDAFRGLVGGYAVSASVLNNFMREHAELLTSRANFEVLNNGIDTARFRPDPQSREATRRDLGFDDQDFVIIFCGHLYWVKRPLFALRVFAGLAARKSRCRLLIVGDGPDADIVKAEVEKLGITSDVVMIGRVSDTATYYAASDAYLSTSESEGCPLAPAEALASGLPAVVPNDETFTSLFGECAAVQVCNPDDPSAWIMVLDALVASGAGARNALAQAARDFALGKFSLEVMNRRLECFYDRVLVNTARVP